MKRNITAAVRAGLGTASIPHVSIKGNAFTLVDSTGEKRPIETKHMDCVIIDAVNNDHRVFWGLDAQGQPKAFDEGGGAPPVCFSDNGVGASTQASEPQSVSCQTCPMSQFNWQSKRDASVRTSACRKLKKLAVLAFSKGGTENNQKNGIYHGELALNIPFALRVPVMSLENLNAYSARFHGNKIDVSQVVTRIKFTQDKVGLLEFDVIGRLDPEVDTLISEMDDHLTDNLVGRGDVAITKLPPPSQSVTSHTVDPALREPLNPPFTPPKLVQEPAPLPAAAPKNRGRPKKLAAPEPIEAERPRTAPFAAPQNGNGGIVENPPNTPEEVEASLDSLFDLPT